VISADVVDPGLVRSGMEVSNFAFIVMFFRYDIR